MRIALGFCKLPKQTCESLSLLFAPSKSRLALRLSAAETVRFAFIKSNAKNDDTNTKRRKQIKARYNKKCFEFVSFFVSFCRRFCFCERNRIAAKTRAANCFRAASKQKAQKQTADKQKSAAQITTRRKFRSKTAPLLIELLEQNSVPGKKNKLRRKRMQNVKASFKWLIFNETCKEETTKQTRIRFVLRFVCWQFCEFAFGFGCRKLSQSIQRSTSAKANKFWFVLGFDLI